MSYFQELKVWQRSVDLAAKVYELTKRDPFNKDFGLKDQIRRSAVSISSNISEGDQLSSDKGAIRHFNIAKGSTAELITQTIISEKIGYIMAEESKFLQNEANEIMAMLTSLIKHRKTGS